MGKIGRFACIFTPMALTIASLICLLLVFLGGLNKNSDLQNSLYFFKADTSNFTTTPNLDLIKGTTLDSSLLSSLNATASAAKLHDFYTVGLWNHCAGTKTRNATGGTVEKVTYCSPRRAAYWFDPEKEWGLNGTAAQAEFPQKLRDGLGVYAKVERVVFTLYTLAFWVTVAEVVVGVFAVCSRWGSCVTTVVSTATTLLTLSASATATALHATLVGTIDATLAPYGIHASLGTRMLAATWLATAFSLAAGLFWLFSTCCCSGGSSGGHGRGGIGKTGVGEKAPRGGYERVGSPYLEGARGAGERQEGGYGGQQSGVMMQDFGGAKVGGRGGAYEPFRRDERV